MTRAAPARLAPRGSSSSARLLVAVVGAAAATAEVVADAGLDVEVRAAGLADAGSVGAHRLDAADVGDAAADEDADAGGEPPLVAGVHQERAGRAGHVAQREVHVGKSDADVRRVTDGLELKLQRRRQAVPGGGRRGPVPGVDGLREVVGLQVEGEVRDARAKLYIADLDCRCRRARYGRMRAADGSSLRRRGADLDAEVVDQRSAAPSTLSHKICDCV